MVTADLSDFFRRLTRGMAAQTLSDHSDRQLIERALAAPDEAVFQAIVERHGPMVYRVSWRILQHSQDAEDAFQATFLVLAQKLRALRKRASLASWLHGVAHRIALKAKAQRAARRRRESQAPSSDAITPDGVTRDGVTRDGVTRSDLHAVVDAELSRLPDKWRLPLVLCYLEGRTQDEAARQLACSKSTLRRRLEEARAALGRRLKGRGIGWSTALSAVLVSDCIASGAPAPGLVAATVEAAAGVAAGKTAAAATSAKVAALTEGVLSAMFMTKVKIATLMFLSSLALLGNGIGLLALPGVDGRQEVVKTKQAAQEPKPLTALLDLPKENTNRPAYVALESGPQAGETLPGPFVHLLVTGKNAGTKRSLDEEYGARPVVMIFAREVSDPLTNLIKKIDAETARNKSARMGSFVVFLSEDENLGHALEALAKKEGIETTILGILENRAGPPPYKLAKDAHVTVILYVKRKVVANHAFKKGELNAKAIDAILADVPKILPANIGGPAPAQAPVSVGSEPTPLAKEVAGADVVVFGMLYHAEAGADKGRRTTEVAILAVIKDHEGLKDKKHFSLKRSVPPYGSSPEYFVLFGAVFKGKVDVYRAISCGGKDDGIVEYLKTIRKPAWAGRVDELAFYFGHLEHSNRDVAEDAFSVFVNATYADLKLASRRYDVKKLEGWLADKNVPETRKELYRALVILCQRVSSRVIGDAFSSDAIPVQIAPPKQKEAKKPADSLPFTLNVGQLHDFLMPSGKWVHDRSMVVLEPASKNWVKVQYAGDRVGWVNLNHVVAVSPTVFASTLSPRDTMFRLEGAKME